MENVSPSQEQGGGPPAEVQQHNLNSRETHRSRPLWISVPQKTLLVLCGPAGSGKSTFARRLVERQHMHGIRSTTIVSSDHCRAMICDDETNQQINHDTFDLFYYIIHKRLMQGRFTIADSTALQANARRNLLDVAQRYHYHTCLLVFNMSVQTCLHYDQQVNRGRVVGEKVILFHHELLRQALVDIPHEGWDRVYILDEQRKELRLKIRSS